jgi:hypothetical protein
MRNRNAYEVSDQSDASVYRARSRMMGGDDGREGGTVGTAWICASRGWRVTRARHDGVVMSARLA